MSKRVHEQESASGDKPESYFQGAGSAVRGKIEMRAGLAVESALNEQRTKSLSLGSPGCWSGLVALPLWLLARVPGIMDLPQ
jgi:hypothetical protein